VTTLVLALVVTLRTASLVHHVVHHHLGHLSALTSLVHLIHHHLHVLRVHHLHLHGVHHAHHHIGRVDLSGFDLLQGVQTVLLDVISNVEVFRFVKQLQDLLVVF